MKTDQIVANNQLISYLKAENAGNKCLLFLHGWRSQKEIWNSVIGKLLVMNNQLSVFALDLPGFGQSPAPKGEWGVKDYAEAVKGFIEKLDLKNVTLVGHSFGGRVAIKIASINPNLLSQLVLVDSAGFAMASKRKNFMAAAAKIARPFFRPEVMRPLRKKIYEKIGAEDYLATPELQKTFVNITNEDLSEDMKRIKVPTLLVWGEDDKETPVEFVHKMRSLMPNTKYQILSNAGHFSFLDQPGEFVKALQSFIE